MLATFPPPNSPDRDAMHLKIAAYHEALADLDISDVAAAMLDIRRRRVERWTPTPGEIRAAVEARRKAATA